MALILLCIVYIFNWVLYFLCHSRLWRSSTTNAMGSNSGSGLRTFWHSHRSAVPFGHGRGSVQYNAMHVSACPLIRQQPKNAIGKWFEQWRKTTAQFSYKTKWNPQLCSPFTHCAHFDMHNDPDNLRDIGRRAFQQGAAMGRSRESLLLLHIARHHWIRWPGAKG